MSIDVVDTIEMLAQFAETSLDFVIASHVIEHAPNPIAALVAAHRVLRSGGKLILIVPDKNSDVRSRASYHGCRPHGSRL